MNARLPAALAVLVSAGVHLYLWFDGYRDVAKIGPSFLLNALGGAVIAVLLLQWRHWVPPLLAIGFGLSTIAGFVTAATVGLFGLEESWSGWQVWVALVSEVAAVVFGGLALLQLRPTGSGRQAQHDATVGGAHLD